MPADIRGITRRDLLLTVLVGVGQLAGTALAAMDEHALDPRPLDVGGYLLLGIGPVLLLWRDRKPPVVLVAVLSATLAYAMLDYPRGPIYFALIVAFVHAVVAGFRVVAYSALVLGYPAFTLLVPAVTGHDRPGMPFLIGVAAWLLVLLVGSELIRIKQAFARERHRRRRDAELAREEEALRRAGEERLEIARELHDVMAHSISLINVQAGVALELMDRRPEQARQALTAIKAASKDALLEVQTMLSSLRGTGESAPTGSAAGSRPPSLADLDVLVARAGLAGVQVETRVDGDPLPLPTGVDQAAARIVQEALTNVARHSGSPTAQLWVSYGHADESGQGRVGSRPSELVIRVDNDCPAGQVVDDQCGAGRGIAGMRERAEAFDGTLEAAPRPGGFRVEARLPITEPPSTAVAGAGGSSAAEPTSEPANTAVSSTAVSSTAVSSTAVAGAALPITAVPGTAAMARDETGGTA